MTPLDSYHAIRTPRGDQVSAVYHYDADGFQHLAIDGLVPFEITGDPAVLALKNGNAAATPVAEAQIQIQATRAVALLQPGTLDTDYFRRVRTFSLHVMQRIFIVGFKPTVVFAAYDVTVNAARMPLYMERTTQGVVQGSGAALFAKRVQQAMKGDLNLVVDVPLQYREVLTPESLWRRIFDAAHEQYGAAIAAAAAGPESNESFAARMRQRRQREQKNAGT